jgi:hypothetical protein
MTVMPHRPRPQFRPLELLVAAFLLAASSVSAQIGPIEDLSAFPSGKLEIADGKTVKHTFDVWLADTPARQAQGLMFVRSLPPARGMLFVHTSPRPISMWMKNTYIPLDMVFIDGRGRIQQIIANTKPHSLDLVRSSEPAVAILELAGGEAQRLALRPGQLVIHPALSGR